MPGGLDQKSGKIWRTAICSGASRTSIRPGLALGGWGQSRSGNLGLGVSLRIIMKKNEALGCQATIQTTDSKAKRHC